VNLGKGLRVNEGAIHDIDDDHLLLMSQADDLSQFCGASDGMRRRNASHDEHVQMDISRVQPAFTA